MKKRLRSERSQAAVEYMILLGIGLVLVIGVSMSFLSRSQDMAATVDEILVQEIGLDMLETIEEVYYQGEHTWKTLTVQFPDGFQSATLTEHEFSFYFLTSKGPQNYIFFSHIPLQEGTKGPTFTDLTVGTHLVKIESRGDHVCLVIDGGAC